MSELTFKKWKRLITSAESADRSEAADRLPIGARNRDEAARILIGCLNDPCALVRTCAADTLGMLPTADVRAALRASLDREQDELTKAYILSSLGAVGTFDDVGRLVEALATETHPNIRIHAALGLAFCALCGSMDELLKHVNKSGKYQNSAANGLDAFLCSHNMYVKSIKNIVGRKLKNKNVARYNRETLETLLENIDNTYNI